MGNTGKSIAMKHVKPIERTIDSMGAFIAQIIHHETTAGVVLFISMSLALAIMNSGLSSYYQALINIEAGIEIGSFRFSEPLKLWVNDGLMTIFFLMVGLEIKKELLDGTLSSPKNAALPAIAALGGMAVPALIYFSLNPEPPASAGWGIPMATDIAFAMGLLALLGPRAPRSIYFFLVALAIVDDLGAVTVIALFYTKHIAVEFLRDAMAIWGIMLLLNYAGVRRLTPYYLLAVLLWFAMLKSGVHATIAGVLTAIAIPAREKTTFTNQKDIVRGLDLEIAEMEEGKLSPEKRFSLVQSVKRRIEVMESPMNRAIHDLHIPVAYLVMPVFAFMNAGITMSLSSIGNVLATPIGKGIAFGLFFGKFFGIFFSSALAVRLNVAKLPDDTNHLHLAGTALLGGVGFTMSIFIASLAFRANEALLASAKTAILLGSLAAAMAGLFVVGFLPRLWNENKPTGK